MRSSTLPGRSSTSPDNADKTAFSSPLTAREQSRCRGVLRLEGELRAAQAQFKRCFHTNAFRLRKRPRCTSPGFFKCRNLLKRARDEKFKRRHVALERTALVILDIDNTLVHCAFVADVPWPVPPPAAILSLPGVPRPFGLFKRPGLDEFLASLRAREGLRVGVWTAGTREYAAMVLDTIWADWRTEAVFLASRGQCTWLSQSVCAKELGLLPRGYNMLLIDDNDDTYKLNTSKGFAVWHIEPFVAESLAAESGWPADEELARVGQYIRDVLDGGGRFQRQPKDKYRAVRSCRGS